MASSWLLIEHGTVIDGDANPPQSDTPVLIKDNVIHAVGPGADHSAVPRGEPLLVLDATGKTVMPGLIDGHCHMTYGEAHSEEEIDLYTSHELRTLIAAWHMQKVLRSGVTSVSQPGGSYFIGVGLREAVNRGMIQGPRTIAAGRYLSTSNSLTDWYPDSVGVPDGSIGILTNTADAIKNEIRHQVKNGVDLIKLADSPFGQYQAFTNDEMKLAADLTHQLNKKITIHARGSSEVDAAVAAGFDWIMHGNIMTEETIGRLAESQIPLVPTLLLLANLADYGDLCGAPPIQRDGSKMLLDITAHTLHQAREAGVKFVAGTDSGFSVTPYGEWHAREMQLLVDYAGLTPLEAIQAGTKNAAVTVNLDGWVGEIAPGKLADIIVIDGDPLRDMSVLWKKEHLSTVIKDGKILEFDDEEVDPERYRRQQGISYSLTALTQDLVYSDGEVKADTASRAAYTWSSEAAEELAHDIKAQEAAQRSDGDHGQH